jgi:hypothetical protein
VCHAGAYALLWEFHGDDTASALAFAPLNRCSLLNMTHAVPLPKIAVRQLVTEVLVHQRRHHCLIYILRQGQTHGRIKAPRIRVRNAFAVTIVRLQFHMFHPTVLAAKGIEFFKG